MKQQRKAVHAIAQAGRLRSIVEQVTEMAAAAAAVNFGPQHPESPVFGLADGVIERLIEAGPAGAALEFGLRGEQRQVAAGASEDALAMLLEQRARARALGALLAQDLILLWRKLRAPFRVGLLDLEFLGGMGRRGTQPAESGKAKQAGDGCEQDTAIDHDGLRAERHSLCSVSNTGLGARSYTRSAVNFSLSCEASPESPVLCPRLRADLPRPAAHVRDAAGAAAAGAAMPFPPADWPRRGALRERVPWRAPARDSGPAPLRQRHFPVPTCRRVVRQPGR